MKWSAAAFAFVLLPVSAQYALSGNGGWVAQLRGPVQRCKVPQRILFVSGDAIINGQITFRGRTYYPRGRLEETLETNLALVRRYGDPKPLVTITAKADGNWNGEWEAAGKGCTGIVRITGR